MPVAAPGERQSQGLGEQVGAIERAQSALLAGDAAEALRRVDDYEARFPTGILAQEATTVRIEALLQKGERGAATVIARKFLASHPTSAHATRIRLMLGPEF
jgi:outer membrane protein assembly factor BamD (BamD/ComL family)